MSPHSQVTIFGAADVTCATLTLRDYVPGPISELLF
jgi:hypothetical protein